MGKEETQTPNWDSKKSELKRSRCNPNFLTVEKRCMSTSVNVMRQLAAYSKSTRSKLDLSEFESNSSSTHDVGESSWATRYSTQKLVRKSNIQLSIQNI